ncbi:MAG: glycosyltransferase [bacterium]|nr:glycosyltransferase [bacterium]
MRVLSIGSDRKLFEEGSAVRARVVRYASLFEELHVVVFNTGVFAKTQIAPNAWLYPTNSWSRWFYVWGAVRIGSRIIRTTRVAEVAIELGKSEKSMVNDWVIDCQDPFECGLAAMKLSKKKAVPLHIQIHTDFLNPYFASLSFLNRIRVRIARRVLPQAQAIRVVSQRIKDSLLQTIPLRGISRRETSYKLKTVPTVLPIFTDIQRFTSAQPLFDLKQKYPAWSFILLVAGRFSEEKNFVFAIEVLKQLVKKYPKTGLVIVGEGPLRGELERAVWRAGLYEHVAFEPWQSDLISYYKTANLFLQTSLYEGFGLALLEAVACGCPSVSSDVGIAPELLNHKGHSFVCPVNDSECFISKVSGLIEDNQLRTFFSLDVAPSVIIPFLKTKEAYLAAYKESLEGSLG